MRGSWNSSGSIATATMLGASQIKGTDAYIAFDYIYIIGG